MIVTQLRQLLQRLGLLRPSVPVARNKPTPATADHIEYCAMSSVQRDTARAARKNPWIMAG